MKLKVTLLLAKARGGLLNSHLIKNGSSSTKPAYKFMVIILLLVIELKATHNGSSTNDCYWREKSCSLNVVQCCLEAGLLFLRPNLYSLTGKF